MTFRQIRGNRPWAVGACLLAAALVSTYSFGHEGHQPLPTKGVEVDLRAGRLTLSRAARDVLDVRTQQVQTRDVASAIRAYATVVAPWTGRSYVTSRLPGRIVNLLARPGDLVEAGQVLAEIDSLDLHTLRQDYQKAQNELALSAKILELLLAATKEGSTSGQKLIEAENSHRQSQNSLDVLRAKGVGLGVSESELIASAEGNAAPLRLRLKSRIRGVVVHADVAVGKFVEPTEHLFEVVDTSRVWVKIGVLEQDLNRVEKGQVVHVSFQGLPIKRLTTKVDVLGLLLDPQTHQGTAWAELENNKSVPHLLPGMNGQAELILPGSSARPCVPTKSIFSDGAERYVFVEETLTKAGSEYRKQSIAIGRQTRDLAEIVSGDVFPGDRVVTRGGHELASLFFLGVLRVGPETAKSIGLKVEAAEFRRVERILRFDGSLDIPPQLRTSASSQLSGTLREIRVDRSQSVKAGDVLAEVASLELQDIQLELLETHLDGVLWRDTDARLRNAGNAVPRRTLLEMDSRVKVLETKFDNIRQKLLTLGLSASQIDDVVKNKRLVDSLPIRAPMDGAIAQFDRVLGQVVRADEPLFEIHDLSQVWVQAFIGERDSSRVHVGQSARIRLVAHPGYEAMGTVSRIGPVVDVDSRTQIAWIEFTKPESLAIQHNMLASVTLTTERLAASLAVPQSAVIRDGLRNFVFVQKSDGVFERRKVELGRADDRFQEIKTGLSVGEMVATEGVPQIQTAYSAVR